MKKFVHYDIPSLIQINDPSGRFYETPEGVRYPSVTSVLGKLNQDYLVEWRAKVGEAVADEISRKAAARGTLIHSACEAYLKGEAFKFNMFQSTEQEMFQNMLPELDRFDEIHALETRLYSDRLKVAGTVDCIAQVEGELYIVDFKTSGRFKAREDIPSYFTQCAAYAVSFWERTGAMVGGLRVLITTQDDGLLVYDEPVKKWVEQFVQLRNS